MSKSKALTNSNAVAETANTKPSVVQAAAANDDGAYRQIAEAAIDGAQACTEKLGADGAQTLAGLMVAAIAFGAAGGVSPDHLLVAFLGTVGVVYGAAERGPQSKLEIN
jgi:hypothetical protein